MTDRPIIFSAPMILALLEGRKTMTRRLATSPLRKAVPGDRLWVRETFRVQTTDHLCSIGVDYCADPGSPPVQSIRAHGRGSGGIDSPEYWDKRQGRNIPPIHMPRIFSRLTLVVTAVKIEPVQEISREDAIAEGLTLVSQHIEQFFRWPAPFNDGLWLSPPAAFEWLWKHIHDPRSWSLNPEVVALTFIVHRSNIDRLKEAA